MLLRKTGLLTALSSLSLPVIQYTGMLQAAGVGGLYLFFNLGYLISGALKKQSIKFSGTKPNRTMAKSYRLTAELRAN